VGYLDLHHRPSSDEVVCLFRVKPAKGVSMRQAAEHIAGESSTGTWTDVATAGPELKRLSAKVFAISEKHIKVAYPRELFEPGNMPQMLSSIAGNIFGMKALDALRLDDVSWPRWLIKSFKGPFFGIEGVRKIIGVKKRPLVGTIIKPKVGLPAWEHAKVAYEAWAGGMDIVKDDENLSDQAFDRFDDRVRKTLTALRKAEAETGERKIYMPNVTAETAEMMRRMRLVKENGGTHVMVDMMTVGWSALQTLREAIERTELAIHAHRAEHAALDKGENGISMAVLASISRIIGVDQLHIGTVVGKMAGGRAEVMMIKEKTAGKGNAACWEPPTLRQDWLGTKPAFPVCSGGLHPGHVHALVRMFGNDIIIQAGGGVHGHPGGTVAGARAMRQAVDAAMEGVTAAEYAKKHKELRVALEKWDK